MSQRKKALIIPNTSKRDALISVGVGLAVLAAVIVMIVGLSKIPGSPSTNQLTGVVVEKLEAGQQEKEITFGKKGLKAKETDSGYSLNVKVEPGGRIYEVPVPKALFDKAKVGDRQSFIRPPSEQR